MSSEAERLEFSLYCIVAGDALTMPLAGEEYVLDVTTELQRAHHPFYLIFCRSVWHHPLKPDAPPLYTEVLFNQVGTPSETGSSGNISKGVWGGDEGTSQDINRLLEQL